MPVDSGRVTRHGIFETALASTREYANPSTDVDVKVRFVSPSGTSRTVDAFWDGSDMWRVRFSPTEIGRWRWQSECSDRRNPGLRDRSGSFDCIPYDGDNPLAIHGPLELSANRRHLMHSDGAPFLWLADTAWNGVLKADSQDWDRYLSARSAQGFTAIQFACTQWRGFDRDSLGETAYTVRKGFRINPRFFQRLDPKVAAINDHGMVASPAILWAVRWGDPGHRLRERDALHLARYIVARWGAHNVFWILGGDGKFTGRHADRWRRIGRTVLGGDRPATLLPRCQSWAGEEFRREDWYSCVGYQSGHSDSNSSLKWLTEGPPATCWHNEPVLPMINLEPCYEARAAYYSLRVFDAHKVRQALYRSLLVAPTAGVTYGHCGIWPWSEKRGVPLNHEGTRIAPPWRESVHAEGAESMRHIRALFTSIQWWDLRPDPGLVTVQSDDPRLFIASARTDDGSLALIHLPEGGDVHLDTHALIRPTNARWFNPSSGGYTPAGEVTGDSLTIWAPSDGDWVLLIGT